MRCPASVVLSENLPRESNHYADEGTAAHELAAMALNNNNDTDAYLGRFIRVGDTDWEVTQEMADYVQEYVDYVRDLGGFRQIEQSLSIEKITGEEGACGTSDAVVVEGDELIIVDLKYGQGLKVSALENEQLQTYASAALRTLSFIFDIKRVRMVIHQPRLHHIDEWDVSVDYLRAFEKRASEQASRCFSAKEYYAKYNELHEKHFDPGEAQCQWCPVKATCPALTQHVLATVADDFVDLDKPVAPQLEDVAMRVVDNKLLGNLMQAVNLVEIWCKAIRSQVETELLSGREVPNFKLVEGRRGHRSWLDNTEAEAAMKAMRVKKDDMYKMSLISPTDAEKLYKSGGIGARQWPKIEALITRSAGKPSVAPVTDKRPALIINPLEGLEDLTEADAEAVP